MKIDILGNSWTMEFRKIEEDPKLEDRDGYCDETKRVLIVAEDNGRAELMDYASYQKQVMRHEIIHAFMFESGLGCNLRHPEYGHDETMVDWLAIQFPKIQKAFQSAGAL